MYLYPVRASADAEVCYRMGCVEACMKKGALADQTALFDFHKHSSRVVCITVCITCAFTRGAWGQCQNISCGADPGCVCSVLHVPSVDRVPRCRLVCLSWAFSGLAYSSGLQVTQACHDQTPQKFKPEVSCCRYVLLYRDVTTHTPPGNETKFGCKESYYSKLFQVISFLTTFFRVSRYSPFIWILF